MNFAKSTLINVVVLYFVMLFFFLQWGREANLTFKIIIIYNTGTA